ncbi:MAG TPA: hypothetical protein ENF34_00400 [Candidatus Bathyarchaeota archaeon]|nr:hypothetical protein [Candidatus Bathyarchaeota archaeon]
MPSDIEVVLRPTRRVVVLGYDERELQNLLYCAITYGVNRLFWVDGYLMCVEVYEESFKREMDDGVFFVSHVCYARFPRYQKVIEVERGAQLPIVNASDMCMLRAILRAVLAKEQAVDVRLGSGDVT